MIVTLENLKCWVKGLKEDKYGAPSGLFPDIFKTISRNDDILMIFVYIIKITINLSYLLNDGVHFIKSSWKQLKMYQKYENLGTYN